MRLTVERIVTSGTFSLDGGTWEVDNNIWIIGDETECVIIDAAHDPAPVLAAVGDRRVQAILLTHAHDDHIGAAPALAAATGAQVWLHPADRMLWDAVHAAVPMGTAPAGTLADGQQFTVAGADLQVLHTPGHSPGSCCFWFPAHQQVFTGDTLFAGGPGATGRSYSDFGTIIDSITTKLLCLPPETVVHTGHGDDTTIGTEAPNRQEWIERGH
ncbi:MAG: MBL fold metallo-hydrolase [Propioniciclava sp.]